MAPISNPGTRLSARADPFVTSRPDATLLWPGRNRIPPGGEITGSSRLARERDRLRGSAVIRSFGHGLDQENHARRLHHVLRLAGSGRGGSCSGGGRRAWAGG